jgi:hypothetical protein
MSTDRNWQTFRGQLMVRFIPAADLKRKFDVFGHFYSVELARNSVIQCRSVLEIVEQNHTPDKISVISKRKPNAVFIMMNPGSSRPLVEVDNRIVVESIHELSISLVPTKPDITQYQVMRLMHYCQWPHVRVLNLSDLRCAKSGAFFKQFKELEEEASFDGHFIFSISRKKELALKMTSDKKIPIICAWGLGAELDPLIKRCAANIKKQKTIQGLLKEGTTNRFLHPLPSLQKHQVSWVNRMVNQCRSTSFPLIKSCKPMVRS